MAKERVLFMKIAMIGHKRVPSREGGIEIVVGELSKGMVQRGCHVDIYNRWEPMDRKKEKMPKVYKGARLIRIPTLKKRALNAVVYSFFATVRAILGKYDVIHYHAEGPCVMMWIPKLFGIPVVATIHGLDWKRAKWGGFASKYILMGERIAAKKADEVIVLSRQCESYFKNTYGRDVCLIQNGITVRPQKKAKLIKEKFGLEERDYILYLGRIVPEKGIHYLLEAFRKICTQKKLVIAGSIEYKDLYVQEICEQAKKDSRVIMTGFVQGTILEELYSNCSVYVLPSDVEGMAISLLEAMSYGARCLLSDIPENKETAGNFATYFEKGNVKNLRKHLEQLLKIEDFSAEEQIDFVKRQYRWDKVIDKTIHSYERAIDSRKNVVGDEL